MANYLGFPLALRVTVVLLFKLGLTNRIISFAAVDLLSIKSRTLTSIFKNVYAFVFVQPKIFSEFC